MKEKITKFLAEIRSNFSYAYNRILDMSIRLKDYMPDWIAGYYELIKRNRELRREAAETGMELKSLEEALEGGMVNLRDTQYQLDTVNAEIERIGLELEDAQKRFRDAEFGLDEQTSRNADLQQKNEEISSELEGAKSKSADLQQKLNAAYEEIRSKDKMISEEYIPLKRKVNETYEKLKRISRDVKPVDEPAGQFEEVRGELKKLGEAVTRLRADNYNLKEKEKSGFLHKATKSFRAYVITMSSEGEIRYFEPGGSDDFLGYREEVKDEKGMYLEDIVNDDYFKNMQRYCNQLSNGEISEFRDYIEFLANDKRRVLLEIIGYNGAYGNLLLRLDKIKPINGKEFVRGENADFYYIIPPKLTDESCKKVCIDLRRYTREEPSKKLVLNFAGTTNIPNKLKEVLEKAHDHFKEHCIAINSYTKPMTRVYSILKDIFGNELYIPAVNIRKEKPAEGLEGQIVPEGA